MARGGRFRRSAGGWRIHLGPDLFDLAYDVIDWPWRHRRRDCCSGCRRLFHMVRLRMLLRFFPVSLRLFMVNRLKGRFFVSLGMMIDTGMLCSRSKRLVRRMRLAPLLNRLVLLRMTLFDMRGRLLISLLVLDRRSCGRLLMDMDLGRLWRRLFLMRLGMDFLRLRMVLSDLFMRRGRFRNGLLFAAR
ncbi:hypothetical protein thsrh120_01610 [Rhizobium sp. No.120]